MPLASFGSRCFTTRSHVNPCCITVFPPHFPPLIVRCVERKLTLKTIFSTHAHSSFLSGTHSGSRISAFPPNPLTFTMRYTSFPSLPPLIPLHILPQSLALFF
ncbi:hypothetical protein PHYBLDRAFT_160325 [Phycomyces blakesleeanus NRRL 1555(-)]|uniref:Uncharacterized protein n=1 Tax=Phycomyces blakesleeanus (strain ATCC 8743b / DSM 1359 / FGSC 10004 / NBRC 33097 / NRRL 1555) TaxID=763407 RepID=A0A162TEK8_PHYB8|nr:hypothetical protein PHYBLDRAFT_160325 [Phycomyces blakesleeanus NRRL 1555(-)]OAD67982.1 hypothetical protein PHYBLDRAFT_160325 [Phycomyces blakesleeanus NRRL 1555(-)]|eukprot:XP_018286022.1 hypothetical protein PHYBLDRAFT_160325 [Phycomyces blakesleeanus NRRL 1555(-)]